MASRTFTVAEVESLIPTLERLFLQIIQLRAALRVQERRIGSAGVPLSPELLVRADRREPFEVRQAKALFRAYHETLAEQIGEVARLGGEVKDLEAGLVDFPSRRGGEEILLCWKLGERRIGFWHTVDGGFGGRRPIDDQVPREPPALD